MFYLLAVVESGLERERATCAQSRSGLGVVIQNCCSHLGFSLSLRTGHRLPDSHFHCAQVFLLYALQLLGSCLRVLGRLLLSLTDSTWNLPFVRNGNAETTQVSRYPRSAWVPKERIFVFQVRTIDEPSRLSFAASSIIN